VSAIATTQEVILDMSRCYDCGRWWAIERGFTGVCPKCASDKIDRVYREQERLGRVVQSLRGVVTRAKNGKRKGVGHG
jgi:hypothetical protein